MSDFINIEVAKNDHMVIVRAGMIKSRKKFGNEVFTDILVVKNKAQLLIEMFGDLSTLRTSPHQVQAINIQLTTLSL
jgi:hypothetical protein